MKARLVMTKEEARQFKTRWQLVNRVTLQEARRLTPEVKLRQLASLYEAGQALGWDARGQEGDAEVRERWRRLKENRHA